jgi:hypothetical protein
MGMTNNNCNSNSNNAAMETEDDCDRYNVDETYETNEADDTDAKAGGNKSDDEPGEADGDEQQDVDEGKDLKREARTAPAPPKDCRNRTRRYVHCSLLSV